LGLHYIRIKPVFFKEFLIFRFDLCRVVGKNKKLLVEKLGFYNANKNSRFLAFNFLRFGY